MQSTLAICLALLGVAIGIWQMMPLGRRPKGLPPGPPTLPIIGNLHQMPTHDSHLHFQKWAKEYGPVYSLILGSQVLIVLSSHEAVRELLDHRSGIYSDRPDSYIAETIMSNKLSPLLMRYGNRWRMFRKLYHRMLSATVSRSYVPYQSLESKQMLRDILHSPKSLQTSLQRYSNSLTTQMIYGWRTSSQDDPKMTRLFEIDEQYVEVANTGLAAFADFFPALRAMPDFCIPVKARARDIYRQQADLYGDWWRTVKLAIAAKSLKPCLCADLARLQEQESFSDEEAAYISGAGLAAGSGTTSGSLYSFVEAMILYPDVQRKARNQIDAVCGGRMPELEDYDRLPYIRCCMRETFRWLPAAPHGAVPHAATQDDHYEGFLIPKGAGVLNNVWTIERDPIRFPDPEVFEPERYADDTGTLVETATSTDAKVRGLFTFGAGRRICQGMHVAEQSMFLAMSRLLWAFEFRPIQGKTPDPNRVTQGFLCVPLPFEVEIQAREGKAEAVDKAWEDAKTLLNNDGQWKARPTGGDRVE